jgi:predicted heme/steroid binding protein
MKRLLSIVFVILLLAGCTPAEEVMPAAETSEPAVGQEPIDMTGDLEIPSDELAAYNGENGMPAYVAVDGVIYDVSDHPEWTTGEHGGNIAGTDITAMLKAAPHGLSKLEDIPQVGTLIADMMADEGTQASEPTLTLEELAAYNGKNGMAAYVAVDGMIYDVTNHPEWTMGEHGGNIAGTDITAMLKAASHGLGKLDEVPMVGTLSSGGTAGQVGDDYDDDDKDDDDDRDDDDDD